MPCRTAELAREDNLRIRSANHKCSESEKKRRKVRRKRRKGWEEAAVDMEGVTYAAGAL